MNFLRFFAPIFLGHPKREAAAPKASGCSRERPVPVWRNRESRIREVAGRRNWPEAVSRKMAAEKGLLTEVRPGHHLYTRKAA